MKMSAFCFILKIYLWKYIFTFIEGLYKKQTKCITIKIIVNYAIMIESDVIYKIGNEYDKGQYWFLNCKED